MIVALDLRIATIRSNSGRQTVSWSFKSHVRGIFLRLRGRRGQILGPGPRQSRHDEGLTACSRWNCQPFEMICRLTGSTVESDRFVAVLCRLQELREIGQAADIAAVWRELFNETPGSKVVREVEEAVRQLDRDNRVFAGPPAMPEGGLNEPPAGPGPTVTDDSVPERVGTVIGPYKLLEQIGQGGFGLVFVAEQQQPVRRKVALKVIKPGMDTRDVIARFEAERQALALMDHPNIARVLDAGATESGRPYFVMEMVRGISITEFCDKNKLTPRERLELFVSVCHAVQHAHQKGIIHRDIKPSNVLVTLHDSKPLVKVIDFGVAKALYQPLTDKTIYTRLAQIIGTPLYMSPEQAEMSGLDIDTRSDIYSLGVLLYELLTGTTPFDRKRLAKAAYDEVIRIIRDEEPPKPSTRLSQSTESLPTIAAQRKTDPARLSKMFRGDLDWITMKALEKDRARRYETASGLAHDVQRYLADEVVEARPPSVSYRVRKFARRNRGLVVAVSLIGLALVSGILGTTWGMMRAAERAEGERLARLDAEAQKASALAANDRVQKIEQKRQADYAAGLVDELIKAEAGGVPEILHAIEKNRRWTDSLLRKEDAQTPEQSEKKLRLALALLPVDPSKIEALRDGLLRVPSHEFVVVRNALLPYKGAVRDSLWTAALDPNLDVQKQFQAACALATYAPKDPRWSRLNKFVAGRLVTLESSALVPWLEALRPVKGQLIEPLTSIFRDANQDSLSRRFAAEALADYVSDRPDTLLDLLEDSQPYQFVVVFNKLVLNKERAIALAHNELAKHPTEKSTESEKEALAKRQANVAIALLRLGAPEEVWPILKASPDPRVRSYVIDWLSPLAVSSQTIIERFNTEPDVTIRRALVLALGEFAETQLSGIQKQPLIEKLLAIYENEPDAGLHGAVEWLLRKWGQDKGLEAVVEKLKSDETQLQTRRAAGKRQWYVNMQKQTFVILDADEFLMGSPKSEPERFPNESQHVCRIGRRFAIDAHEVTKSQWRTFHRTAKGVHWSYDSKIASQVRTEDSPIVGMNWYEAAHYCNWLSEQEGIGKDQWCYEPNKQGTYLAGMRPKDKFWKLTGYRMPMEAEWEFTCRAGTVTSRYYGISEDLLPKYAWYFANSQNRTWPVGRLKPNDLGVFDMLGNAYEWCFDLSPEYSNVPTTQPVEDAKRRVLRGGAFNNVPEAVRSADRHAYQADFRSYFIGFRPARTLP
jgi:serine/threonine protein kinase/formylglycine-generating enzyme required for sulfatase activity